MKGCAAANVAECRNHRNTYKRRRALVRDGEGFRSYKSVRGSLPASALQARVAGFQADRSDLNVSPKVFLAPGLNEFAVLFDAIRLSNPCRFNIATSWTDTTRIGRSSRVTKRCIDICRPASIVFLFLRGMLGSLGATQPRKVDVVQTLSCIRPPGFTFLLVGARGVFVALFAGG